MSAPSPRKPAPPKPRIPLPRKPPKTIEPDTAYKRKPKHPKQNPPGEGEQA